MYFMSHTHTYIHVCMYTYIHTYIYICHQQISIQKRNLVREKLTFFSRRVPVARAFRAPTGGGQTHPFPSHEPCARERAFMAAVDLASWRAVQCEGTEEISIQRSSFSTTRFRFQITTPPKGATHRLLAEVPRELKNEAPLAPLSWEQIALLGALLAGLPPQSRAGLPVGYKWHQALGMPAVGHGDASAGEARGKEKEEAGVHRGSAQCLARCLHARAILQRVPRNPCHIAALRVRCASLKCNPLCLTLVSMICLTLVSMSRPRAERRAAQRRGSSQRCCTRRNGARRRRE